ncbi:MAG TPA: GNAT family N-acetyltransferase [Agriterribacter sp.]|nr:GNAT family N-acetyltransferase [Agriterribacter sp.]
MNHTFPVFKTNRLLLRQFSEGDVDDVYTALSHPDVIRYYGVRYDSVEGTQTQMDWFAELEATGKGRWWAVCSPDGSMFYGAAGVYHVNEIHRKAEIGFWLLPAYWGKGIMKEAIPLILDYAFKHFDIHRMEAFVETENRNSKTLLTQLHFEHEGTMKDCEIKDGNFISLDIYARLK